jgi:hypothetical protein
LEDGAVSGLFMDFTSPLLPSPDGRKIYSTLVYFLNIMQMTRTTNFVYKIVLTVRKPNFGASKGLLPPIALGLVTMDVGQMK